jgi:hypothetical protein
MQVRNPAFGFKLLLIYLGPEFKIAATVLSDEAS